VISPSKDLYLTKHNNHNRQISIYAAGFEPTIPASEQPQTHALDRKAAEIGYRLILVSEKKLSE
jgi:hypothetical protein